MVSLKDIYWAAGIYEGEGCFGGRTVYITQKDTWILYKLRSIFGFGNVLGKTNGTCSQWTISGQNARGFLLTIFSILSPRRKREILGDKTFFKDANFKCYDSCKNGHPYVYGSFTLIYSRRRKKSYKRCEICYRNKLKREKIGRRAS